VPAFAVIPPLGVVGVDAVSAPQPACARIKPGTQTRVSKDFDCLEVKEVRIVFGAFGLLGRRSAMSGC
jgi:hypothetical protein